MGGFYLDVIKDRQYTSRADGLPRRSCQTAMFHIVEAMVRWMAPVLSFTADEIWRFMPGERGASVFMETWYQGLFPLASGPLDADAWRRVIGVKTAVAKQLELMRKEGVIGSSLDAEVELYCDEHPRDSLFWHRIDPVVHCSCLRQASFPAPHYLGQRTFCLSRRACALYMP